MKETKIRETEDIIYLLMIKTLKQENLTYFLHFTSKILCQMLHISHNSYHDHNSSPTSVINRHQLHQVYT